jgi:septal ring factor EnvC (AmiA/AmiB activator)
VRIGNISRFGRAIGVLIITVGFMYPMPSAHASWLDRVKEIYQLPSNVEQIQKDYEATKQQLEEQKDKLSEAVRQSQEIEDRLLSQNEALKKDNEQLQERLKAMEQVALDKDKRNRKITYMVITAAALVVGYFLLGRVFRFFVWRRQKRGLR